MQSYLPASKHQYLLSIRRFLRLENSQELCMSRRVTRLSRLRRGIGCGQAGIPGVYADVQKLLPWIQTHLPGGYP